MKKIFFKILQREVLILVEGYIFLFLFFVDEVDYVFDDKELQDLIIRYIGVIKFNIDRFL